tara:strand:- start:492 stop:818 length:327 start_codon:yes stop_codon:yes gene_type:complete
MRASRGMGIINPKKCCSKVLSKPSTCASKPKKMKAGGLVKNKVKKVIKGLKKASKSHAKQAKTLESLKLKKGGTVKDACYKKVKASYKVFPSAYASGAIAKCRKKGGK